MWKKYSSEIMLAVLALNLAFTLVAWMQTKQEIASLRQGEEGSQQLPFQADKKGDAAGATGGVAFPPASMPAIPPEVEKQLKAMNAKGPSAPVSGAAGNPSALPSLQDQKPAAQKEQPKK